MSLKWIFPLEDEFINNLSLEVKKGKILTIFGVSGIGKSSLINVISGIFENNLSFKGDIILNNKRLNEIPAENRKIGLLLQEGVLFPHLTVEQNLLFGMNKNLKNKEKSLMISNHLLKSDMDGFQKRYPNTLSGGQKARIACLRAILSEPDALLLDEPFSSLDPDQRNSFRLFVIKQVQDRNIPCILVTHDESDKAISDYKPLDLNIFHP
jgi:putative thiamine transport system ATP-binding protein